MRPRQEQVVLLAFALLVAWLVWSDVSGGGPRGRRRRPSRLDPVSEAPPPDVALALPRERAPGALDRDVFSPPRDTEPLAPLALESPPLVELPGLRPPTVPGPDPALYGRFLRARVEPVDVPGLFAAEADLADLEPADLDPLGAPAGSGTALERDEDLPPLTPEERMEQVAGYKRLYDWIDTGELKFGRIRNKDRYGLEQGEGDGVLFVEFDPRTGVERYSGQPPIEYGWDRVRDFAFADTVENRLELRRRELVTEGISAANYVSALAFAAECVAQRLETPRAIEIAEEIFRLCAAYAPDDPAPRLGLARCYEASFRFEDAFQLYSTLLAEGRDRANPVIHARLGRLYERFRLFAEAERELREAERFGRTSWEVRWALGRFLHDRGRSAEALEHLRVANQYEPTDPQYKNARVAMRNDLGDAHVALGELAEGASWFQKALQADPTSQHALAGLNAVEVLRGGVDADSAADAELDGSAGFELVLARGRAALARSEWTAARDELELAAAANPLRAVLAWRTLSFLAEATGYGEDALRFVELAYENDPTDPYTLYQRGRVLAARDDVDGAMESFRRALDEELDLSDALAAMGELAHRLGRNADTERYLERALALDPSLVDAQALRGLNLLELGQTEDAVAVLDEALALDREHPTARNGRAWSYYALGDSREALTRLADLDDLRRRQGHPDEDPHRAWARAQIERIQDHEEKVRWSDRFERREIKNGWMSEEPAGPRIDLREGRVWLQGQFDKPGRTRLVRELPADQFVALQASVRISAPAPVRVGLFVSREMRRRNEDRVEAEVTVSRHKEGQLQTRLMKGAAADTAYEDVPAIGWPLGEWVPVRIERTGQSRDTRIRISVDGIPVLDGVSFPALGTSSSMLRIGVFAEGETARSVTLEIDDVEVIRRQP